MFQRDTYIGTRIKENRICGDKMYKKSKKQNLKFKETFKNGEFQRLKIKITPEQIKHLDHRDIKNLWVLFYKMRFINENCLRKRFNVTGSNNADVNIIKKQKDGKVTPTSIKKEVISYINLKDIVMGKNPEKIINLLNIVHKHPEGITYEKLSELLGLDILSLYPIIGNINQKAASVIGRQGREKFFSVLKKTIDVDETYDSNGRLTNLSRVFTKLIICNYDIRNIEEIKCIQE